jgi:hypothetical protein
LGGLAFRAETRVLGKASHRGGGHRGNRLGGGERLWVDRVVTGGHRGGSAPWMRKALGGQGGFWVGNTHWGGGIAQRSRRSQRGNRCGGCERLWVDRVVSGREMRALDEGIAQRSRRGDLVDAHRNFIGNTVASGRRNWLNGKASHRGHRRGFGLVSREFYR